MGFTSSLQIPLRLFLAAAVLCCKHMGIHGRVSASAERSRRQACVEEQGFTTGSWADKGPSNPLPAISPGEGFTFSTCPRGAPSRAPLPPLATPSTNATAAAAAAAATSSILDDVAANNLAAANRSAHQQNQKRRKSYAKQETETGKSHHYFWTPADPTCALDLTLTPATLCSSLRNANATNILFVGDSLLRDLFIHFRTYIEPWRTKPSIRNRGG